jgi:hypothetical protein
MRFQHCEANSKVDAAAYVKPLTRLHQARANPSRETEERQSVQIEGEDIDPPANHRSALNQLVTGSNPVWVMFF